MDRIVPILPCPNLQEQVGFYKGMGFQLIRMYTSPNPYAVLQYGEIEIHFFGNKKFIPSENSSMCILFVDHVDKVCETFTNGLKRMYSKIPRSGIPKITKVRDLAEDRRFTLTDMGGNTFYICTANQTEGHVTFRVLSNDKYAKDFKVLYDLLHSKEDKKLASIVLAKMLPIKNDLNDCDLAKFLLVELEIRGISADNEIEILLNRLLDNHRASSHFWESAEIKYKQLLLE